MFLKKVISSITRLNKDGLQLIETEEGGLAVYNPAEKSSLEIIDFVPERDPRTLRITEQSREQAAKIFLTYKKSIVQVDSRGYLLGAPGYLTIHHDQIAGISERRSLVRESGDYKYMLIYTLAKRRTAPGDFYTESNNYSLVYNLIRHQNSSGTKTSKAFIINGLPKIKDTSALDPNLLTYGELQNIVLSFFDKNYEDIEHLLMAFQASTQIKLNSELNFKDAYWRGPALERIKVQLKQRLEKKNLSINLEKSEFKKLLLEENLYLSSKGEPFLDISKPYFGTRDVDPDDPDFQKLGRTLQTILGTTRELQCFVTANKNKRYGFLLRDILDTTFIFFKEDCGVVARDIRQLFADWWNRLDNDDRTLPNKYHSLYKHKHSPTAQISFYAVLGSYFGFLMEGRDKYKINYDPNNPILQAIEPHAALLKLEEAANRIKVSGTGALATMAYSPEFNNFLEAYKLVGLMESNYYLVKTYILYEAFRYYQRQALAQKKVRDKISVNEVELPASL